MSIRLRLTLLYSSLLIAMLILFSVAVFGILGHLLHSQIDDDLVETLDDIERIILENRDAEGHIQTEDLPLRLFHPADNMYIQLWLPKELELINLSKNLESYTEHLDPNAVGHNRTVFSNVRANGVDLRVATRPLVVDGQTMGYLQVATSTEPIENAIHKLAIILTLLGTIGGIIAFFVGRWMASKALTPINSINQTAQQIVAADDLKRRVPYTGNDELGALTETINRMLERLDRLFSSQQQFVSDVSHELRTPLAAIQGHVEIIQRFGYDEESMEAIARSTERMVYLVEDLMFLANADIGRVNLILMPVDLDTLLLEVYNHVKAFNKEQVAIYLQNIEHIQVNADPHLLKKLLKHLLMNAIAYTDKTGQITLDLRQHDQWVDVIVSDTGIGIAEEDLARIFYRFYRADKARSRLSGGSGLGLSIALWIARAHGGDLLVESQLGHGTTFTVRLPHTSSMRS